jgi:hypothetical protein
MALYCAFRWPGFMGARKPIQRSKYPVDAWETYLEPG